MRFLASPGVHLCVGATRGGDEHLQAGDQGQAEGKPRGSVGMAAMAYKV